MEEKIVSAINIITIFCLLFIFNEGAIIAICIQLVLLIGLLIYLLLKFKKKYISTEIVSTHFAYIIVQIVLLYIFQANIPNGTLDWSGLLFILYIIIQILFLGLLLGINLIKFVFLSYKRYKERKYD